MSLSITEEWRDVKGYERIYQVSSHGRVKSLDRVTVTKAGKKKRYKSVILKPGDDKSGYKMVTLSKEGKTKSYAVHILMAYAFLGRCPGKHGTKIGDYQINHKNENHLDNYSWNLEWLPVEEHIKVSLASPKFLQNISKGENHIHSKVTKEDVNKIRNDFRIYEEISKEYNISITTVTNIIKGRSWKSVPYHVELKEKQNNIRRMQTEGSNHPGAKLNKDTILEILVDTRSQKEISKEYGVSQSKICRIKKRQSYKKVMLEIDESGILESVNCKPHDQPNTL